MKTIAGIVMYNPDPQRLSENIEAVKNQVDRMIFVDNASLNLPDIKQLLPGNSILIENKKNAGVARALNQIFVNAVRQGADWVLTLDQDSVCRPNLVKNYAAYIGLPDVGILTCQIEDRNQMTLGLSDFQTDFCEEIERCITSGSFCSVEAYKKTGGFVNELFIDWVDYEYCANLRRHGYRIYRLDVKGLMHEIGHGQKVQILGHTFQVYHGPPMRQYCLARNRLYTALKYPEYHSVKRELQLNMRNIGLVWLYEDQKLLKTRSILRGMFDSRKLWKKSRKKSGNDR